MRNFYTYSKIRSELDVFFANCDTMLFFGLISDTYQFIRSRRDKPQNSTGFPSISKVDRNLQTGLFEWDLETVLIYYLSNRRNRNKKISKRLSSIKYRWTQSEALCRHISYLNDINYANDKSNKYLYITFNRLMNKQGPWQIGFEQYSSLYRYMYIYNVRSINNYFYNKYGFRIEVMTLIGTIIHHIFCLRNYLSLNEISMYLYHTFNERRVEYPVSHLEWSRALAHISSNLETIKKEQRKKIGRVIKEYGHDIPIDSYPSVLREKPIIYIESDMIYVSPLSDLICERVTSGIFYDIVSDGSLVNIQSDRFESYVRMYLEASFIDFRFEKGSKYGKKLSLEEPDIICSQDDIVYAIFECKAVRYTYEAQFGKDPLVDAKEKFQRIAKGIYQIWKFRSECRRGVINRRLDDHVSSFVITLDNWNSFGKDIKKGIIEYANYICNKDKNILEEDKVSVRICSINDIEIFSSYVKSKYLISLLRYYSQNLDNFDIMSAVNKKFGCFCGEQKNYPFELKSVVGWSGVIK